MGMSTESWIPLFPLELVLLPDALLPLHIFEPRYRALVRRCLDETTAFGITRREEENLRPIGCEAAIVQVLRTYEDGRLDLLTRGRRPFLMRELREHADGYLEAQVEFLADAAEPPEPGAAETLRHLFREFRRLAAEEAADAAEAAVPIDEEALARAGYTFPLGASIPMELDQRQELLETRSEHRREQILSAHLARLLPALRAGRENREKIRGNGKPLPTS